MNLHHIGRLEAFDALPRGGASFMGREALVSGFVPELVGHKGGEVRGVVRRNRDAAPWFEKPLGAIQALGAELVVSEGPEKFRDHDVCHVSKRGGRHRAHVRRHHLDIGPLFGGHQAAQRHHGVGIFLHGHDAQSEGDLGFVGLEGLPHLRPGLEAGPHQGPAPRPDHEEHHLHHVGVRAAGDGRVGSTRTVKAEQLRLVQVFVHFVA
mmetsp:Transcript_46852/g.106029  ORF Transcript_46852/g.106029 Transcript_46852/m.106029 type:complete len:208 (+) Transcript_46852:529-1152(+)